MRVWAGKELRVEHDQTSCYLRPPFLGTPLVPLKVCRAVTKRAATWCRKQHAGTWYDTTRRDTTRRDTTRHDTTRNDMTWSDVKWRDVMWHDVTWRDVTWRDFISWHVMKRCDITSPDLLGLSLQRLSLRRVFAVRQEIYTFLGQVCGFSLRGCAVTEEILVSKGDQGHDSLDSSNQRPHSSNHAYSFAIARVVILRGRGCPSSTLQALVIILTMRMPMMLLLLLYMITQYIIIHITCYINVWFI